MLNIESFLRMRLMFPELTEPQFHVLMNYAFGSRCETIADTLKCSQNAVKLSLRRIKENLDTDSLDTVRHIYNTRVYMALMAPKDFPQKYFDGYNRRKKAAMKKDRMNNNK